MTAEKAETARNMEGSALFVRYAFMPNRLEFCGPDDNSALFEHALKGSAEPKIGPLLKSFTGAYPYLQLIAYSNGIADPFHQRVVEAYWIGNELLEGVEARWLYDSLRERFKDRMSPRTLDLVIGKAPMGARPHHSFHVMDALSRQSSVTGEIGVGLEAMEECRIGWGKVRRIEGSHLAVEHQPLVLEEGKLALGDPIERRVLRRIQSAGFTDSVEVGDWVSFHWGWACGVLTQRQVRLLESYTHHHIRLTNLTL